MSPFLAEAPGGDTLLDVHPTQLQVLRKGCILPKQIYLEGDEGRAKRRISARSESAAFLRAEVRRGGRKGAPLHLKQKITKLDF